MAFKLSTEAQLVFFNKVFGPTSAVATMAGALIGAGVTFETSLYGVRAKSNGTELDQITLSVGTTALIKGTVEPHVAESNKGKVVEWISALFIAQGSPSSPKVAHEPTGDFPMHVVLTGVEPQMKLKVIKAVMNLIGVTLLTAKTTVDTAVNTGYALVSIYPSTAAAKEAVKILQMAGGKVMMEVPTVQHTETGIWSGSVESVKVAALVNEPVNAVIALRDAKALGQKVHGTSTGSVYYCIALTNAVKVAARIKGDTISIRTEWTDTPAADLKKLADAGVEMKAEYGSIHFSSAGVPVQRVIGAFLMGTGIEWQQMITSGSKLVVS